MPSSSSPVTSATNVPDSQVGLTMRPPGETRAHKW